MAASVKGVSALQEELVKTKENLHNVDENIKKLTGREPGDNRPQRRVTSGRDEFRGRERLFAAARRGVVDEFGSPPAKRRSFGTVPSGRGALSRLGPRVAVSRVRPVAREDSGDEDELFSKPVLQSSVVVSDSKSRQDTIEQQNKDKAGKTRNRRMFGLLLGTLQRFKAEEKQKEDQEHKRKVVEQKLENKAIQEKEDLRRERSTLFNRRREQQGRLRRLEQKMELVEIHEDWEKQTKQLMNFIRTKAKPHIFFKPKIHHAASDKKRRETCKILEEIIIERRKQLEEEIDELTKLPEEKENQECMEDKEKEEEEEEDESMEVEQTELEKHIRHSHARERKHSDSHQRDHKHHKSHERKDSDHKRKSDKRERHASGEQRERRHRKRTISTHSDDNEEMEGGKQTDEVTERGEDSGSKHKIPEAVPEDGTSEKDPEEEHHKEDEEEETAMDSLSKLKSHLDVEPDDPTVAQRNDIPSDHEEQSTDQQDKIMNQEES